MVAIGPARKRSTADERNVWDAARYAIPYVDSSTRPRSRRWVYSSEGCRCVIVNPAHVLGAGDPGRSSTVLVRRFLRREIPAYVDGTFNIVGVEAWPAAICWPTSGAGPASATSSATATSRSSRLFMDLARLSGVEPPPLKVPVHAGAASSGQGARGPSVGFVTSAAIRDPGRVAELGVSSAKAKRELGWRPRRTRTALEETIAWYRERDGERLRKRGRDSRSALRMAGAFARRSPGVAIVRR